MAEEKVIKKPLPEITPVNEPFWDGAKAGKLMRRMTNAPAPPNGRSRINPATIVSHR